MNYIIRFAVKINIYQNKVFNNIVKHKLLNLKIVHKNYASDVIVAKFDKSVNSVLYV